MTERSSMKTSLLTISFILVSSLTSCATTAPTKAEDLRVGHKYNMVGLESMKSCTLRVDNIVTVLPTQAGPVPVQAAYEVDAMICGWIDCSAERGPDAQRFDCGKADILYPSKQ